LASSHMVLTHYFMRLCSKVCLARSIVREANEMKIAQRFSAGVRIHKIYISPRSGRLKNLANTSSPFRSVVG
jgi:hypothetical protein